MIKALVKKELRENVMVAALGMLGAILLTAWTYHGYKAFIAISPDHPYAININTDRLQPVVWPAFLTQLACLCGLFGAALGFMQIFHERHRDLWGYLIHRPATRTQIFLGKMIAGLALYFIAIGLPLGAFVIWDATPGHVAAPFEWVLVSPTAKIMAAGVAFYFAGMLTGLRQARWWASRALGLGLALGSVFISFISFEDPGSLPFWGWVLCMGFCVGVLALAGWGSFLSHGEYRGQPRLGKPALTAALFVGATMMLAFAYEMASNLLGSGNQNDYTYRSYVMTTNGVILESCQGVRQSSMTYEYFDLAGKPVMSASTGKPLNNQEFGREAASQGSAWVNFGDRPGAQWYRDNFGFVVFSPVRSVPGRLWYYWHKKGRLVEYDVQSRLPIASLGPEGYADDVEGKGGRFVDSSTFDNRSDTAWRLLYTRTTAYEANLDERTFKPIFGTTTNEPIGAMTEFQTGQQFFPSVIGASEADISFPVGNFMAKTTNVLLVTGHFVRVLSWNGTELLKADYKPEYPDYALLYVWALQPAGSYAVRFEPTAPEKRKKELGLKAQVTWYGGNSTLTKSEPLPDLPEDPMRKPTWSETLANLWFPLAAMIPSQIFDDPKPDALAIALSCIGALVSVGIGWWVGRRYSMSRGGLIGWGIFILLLNIFGLATFFCVQEWPARERCPNCKKLRVVDRAQCEHCGVDFAAAEKNGTEIFEPLGTG